MPFYNFKKAFYGKQNRKDFRGALGTLRKDGRSMVKKAYGQAVGQANSYLSKNLRGSGSFSYPKNVYTRAAVGRGMNDGGSMGLRRRSIHGKPIVHVREKGEMCITHSEYIGELVSSGTTGSSNFVSQSYGINPGDYSTFPWLSSTAINFQQFKFNKLVFEYRPLISESTSTSSATLTSMGSVILATQYDSVQGPYVNKPNMENSDYSVSSKPSEKIMMAVECKSKFNPLGTLYVSGQTNTTVGTFTNSDIRFQNLGIFQIASANIPIAANTALDLGEIWVHYDIELYKPQLNAGLSNLQSAHYQLSSVTAANTLGTSQTAAAGNILPLTFPTNTSFAFPLAVTQGSFFVCLSYQYVSGSTFVSVTPTIVQGSLIQIWDTNSGTDAASFSAAPNQAGAATLTAMYCLIVTVNAPGSALCTLTFPANTMSVNPSRADLFVTPWNSGMIA